MKIALYIEEGVEQIVLTPTSDTEAALLAKLRDKNTEFRVRSGSFYHCQGGWVRQGHNDDSTIFVMTRRHPGAASDACRATDHHDATAATGEAVP